MMLKRYSDFRLVFSVLKFIVNHMLLVKYQRQIMRFLMHFCTLNMTAELALFFIASTFIKSLIFSKNCKFLAILWL